MTGEDDLNTTQWAAVVTVLLVLLVPLAVALAAWFKQRYARAVVRLQAELADAPARPPPAEPAAEVPAVAGALRLEVQRARELPPEAFDAAVPARRLRRRVLAVQFAAGLAYWWTLLLVVIVALLLWQQATGDADDGNELGAAATHLLVWPLLLLPPLLGWAFQAGLPERRVWTVAGVVALVFGTGLYVASADLTASAAVGVAAALVAALLAAFLRPAVRGAGPPLVAALTVGLLVYVGLFALIAALEGEDDSAMTASDWLLGIGAMLGLLLPAGWVARRMLLRLARRYGEKRFSELQLALGAYWGVLTAFVVGAVLMLSFEARTGAAMEWVALAVGLVWWLWRLLQRLALWVARRGAPAPLGGLLMLRVFKPSHRSEAFTDRFLARWRFAGPVWMIAGPDLAGAYMEPDEFFAFLGGRLKERFIARDADLAARLQSLDDARDPDGRCRVNELFCSNAAWQAAVRALIDRAAVVLLDLREFTPARAGTRYELEQVLRRVPLAKVVLIADTQADLAPLRAAIEDAWRRSSGQSTDRSMAPTLTLLTLDGDKGGDLRGLVAAVARAARSSAP